MNTILVVLSLIAVIFALLPEKKREETEQYVWHKMIILKILMQSGKGVSVSEVNKSTRQISGLAGKELNPGKNVTALLINSLANQGYIKRESAQCLITDSGREAYHMKEKVWMAAFSH